MAKAADKQASIREAAENSLVNFIKLIAPHRVLGSVHRELCEWWEREDHKPNQLVLLPRDHQKSAMIAYRVAWRLTKEPWMTFLYISATSGLAEKQLKFIKDIMTSPIYRRYWPEMVNVSENAREQWTTTQISVDHPSRKREGVRDSSVFAAGLTTNITGLHCNIAVLDDLVVPENAYTEEGRTKVKDLYSLLSSIETTGSEEWTVGTRYAGSDLYNDMLQMEETIYDEEGNEVGSEPIYEVFERVLEDSPKRDGTGQYTWPRQRRSDGRFFGFDIKERAKKFAKYLNKTQFYSQYYNDPSDPSNLRVDPRFFQYYEVSFVRLVRGDWYFKEKKLNIIAALDLAFTEGKRSDYTVILVAGIDEDGMIYVLDIDRFRTSKVKEIFDRLLAMNTKWQFRRCRAETTSGQEMIVNELKRYMREYGVFFSIDEYNPSRHEGAKEERIDLTLIPRYENYSILHYRGGNCQILEDELMATHPDHDDTSDALHIAVGGLRAPSRMKRYEETQTTVRYHPRFGGFTG